MQKILVTGSAGFIGFHLINKLIKYDFQILGIDSLNDYYSIKLKLDRLSQLGIFPEKIDKNNLINSSFHKDLTFACIDISDAKMINRLFEEHKFNVVINLAAQAGVRYSMINPKAYLSSNINGFFNILEACKEFPVSHLIYASTSSVYGLNTNFPLKENESTDNPVSLYAATKKTNELMAHAYSNLFGIPTTGLRFFTVYGPWGRPDMSPFLFTNAIFNGHPINVFNNGNMMRDFTFIDDIVESIYRLIELPPKESLSVYVNNENSVSNNKILFLTEF